MFLWRLTRAAYQALDGEGARLYGGRWNSEGIAVVHLASSLSLCALDYLAHIDIEDVPTDLVAMKIFIPKDAPITELDVSALPAAWYTSPDSEECSRSGDKWVKEGSSLLLRVPSALIPAESNYLLNPAHPDAARVKINGVTPFAFASRLLDG